MKDNFEFTVMIKKCMVLIIGIAISAFGISLFYALNIGTDPISVLVDGEHNLMQLDYGTVTLINNIVLIVFGLIFARKYLHVGTVIGGLVMGPFINLFLAVLNPVITDTMSYFTKFVLLFPAVGLMGLGIAIVIGIEFGVGSMDLLTLTLRDVTKLKLKWVKMGLDVIFTIAGYLMGGIIGAGTIVGVLLTGPIIGFLVPRLKKLFSKSLKLELATEN